MIKRLAVIGVGLIGGSFSLALKAAGKVEHVVGVGRDPENLQLALERGVIDSFTHRVEDAVKDADLVFIAVPLGSMTTIFEAIRPVLGKDTVFTDGGSVKGSVVASVRSVFGEIPANFVPGHPIAGTEQSGAGAAFATLYNQRRVILTPQPETSAEALELVSQAWQACGAEVICMDTGHHDEVLAATSHLPHMLAYSLVDSLAQMKENDEIFRFAAGGFRDFTRIASSSPQMWRDICLANREHLGTMLGRFADELNLLAEALKNGDGETLLNQFERAKAARDRYIDGV